MVIAADGTKWSCVSCLKGHRVSGCNHTDRELKLVPKKGRPVTQCQHCRQERKKRSAHVKCDCAEPDKPHHSREKCIHLREAEELSKQAHFDDYHTHEKDIAHLTAVAEEQGCCCSHGGKCSCALIRKNSSDDEVHQRAKHIPKPRLETTRSDSSTAIFANGIHKPLHRHGAHDMPYRTMVRSKTDPSRTLRRSVDGTASSSTRPLATQTGYPAPELMANLLANAGGLTANKLGVIDFGGVDDFESDVSLTTPPITTEEAWPAFDSNDLFSSEPYSYVDSNIDLSNFNLIQPALTAASSGTQSEIDELPIIDDIYAGGAMPSIQEDSLDQPGQAPGSPSTAYRRSLPPGFFGNIDFTVPDMGGDWQTQDTTFAGYEKTGQDVDFSDPWLAPPRNSLGRPTAHSVGSINAPNVDVLKQLFPDIDMDTSVASPRTQAYNMEASRSSSYDGNLMASRAWSDGSVAMAGDAYATFMDQTYQK